MQWCQVVLSIVIDFVEGTWNFDACVVVLRGLPGSGKSTFADILAAEFRKEFDLVRERFTRICAKALYQVGQAREQTHGQAFMQAITDSLAVADVVIVDDTHIFTKELECVETTACHLWSKMGLHGKVYTVNFACRDEEHALMLNHRSWHPLPNGEIRKLYGSFAELETKVTHRPDCFTIDPGI
ncbi:hypothetical protein V7S43_009826 [Phytophthora oleae]|uniref:AAA+ ATPase domain-containing protein n=1 Tax=Phytophthora oleae TaxID=2107226 RepID=A0ABD3FEK3_9STRA